MNLKGEQFKIERKNILVSNYEKWLVTRSYLKLAQVSKLQAVLVHILSHKSSVLCEDEGIRVKDRALILDKGDFW